MSKNENRLNFRDNVPRPTTPAGIQIDHKRLQRLREKKMAMGHKWNDHENELNYKYMEPSM